MDETNPTQIVSKQMLVTVGTTKFESLIRNIDREDFYLFLDQLNFTKLIIQKGTGEYVPHKYKSKTLILKNLRVEVYDLLKDFEKIIKNSDYIISHGGAGNVLESLKYKKKLFVVVNDLLMDNHQVELAETLQRENYIFYLKNLPLIVEDIKSVLDSEIIDKNNTSLKQYPDFNLETVPNVIYDMLEL
jgi:beta-1,4-N-acetylglucosaminyltransferase